MKFAPAAFLTAQWRELAMLHYEIDPAVLAPDCPAGTEIATFEGRSFVSLVGFLFLETRVLDVPVPFHQKFEEVNLRFYVRRRVNGNWRRGVVFLREIVSSPILAFVARALYGERYLALPTRHRLETEGEETRATYGWTFESRESQLSVTVSGLARIPPPGSAEEFLVNQPWGYTRRGLSRTLEYRVDHTEWKIRNAVASGLDCDVERLYGKRFVDVLAGKPSLAFLADGSAATVFTGATIDLASGEGSPVP